MDSMDGKWMFIPNQKIYGTLDDAPTKPPWHKLLRGISSNINDDTGWYIKIFKHHILCVYIYILYIQCIYNIMYI